MRVTENEAAAMWCPMVRYVVDLEDNSIFSNRHGLGVDQSPCCIGSRCMLWQWFDAGQGLKTDDRGECGLGRRAPG